MERGAKQRVLVVDDDPDVLALLVTMLEVNDDFEVVAYATNITDAIDAAIRTTPDAVVLDVMMADMAGWQVLPLLRRALPAARIVVLSAFPDPVSMAEALVLGADSFLSKAAAWSEVTPVLAELNRHLARRPAAG